MTEVFNTWFDTNLERDIHSTISLQELYKNYSHSCHYYQVILNGKKTFSKILQDPCNDSIKLGQIKISRNPKVIFKGLALVDLSVKSSPS